MSSEVTDLIDALRNGRKTLDEVAQRFRQRSWPRKNTPAPATYLELAIAAQQDPRPDVPGSVDEITGAYDRGELDRTQYRTLVEAAAESMRAEDRRKAEEASGSA